MIGTDVQNTTLPDRGRATPEAVAKKREMLKRIVTERMTKTPGG